jgi:hypothetical protein
VFKYLDFTDSDVISKYGLKNTTDIYAKKFDNKDIFIIFNKKLNSNLSRYLFLKVWAYDILDAWKKDDELRLSLKINASDVDILAERIAIEMTLTRWQLKLHDDGTEDPALKRALTFCEPEILEIRRKNYKDKGVIRNWTLLSVRK